MHDQQFGFRHLPDGVAQTLATEPGIFDTAIGHVVNAKRRNVSRDQAADFEFVIRLKDELRVPRKKPGLQAIRRTVDLLQRRGEIIGS